MGKPEIVREYSRRPDGKWNVWILRTSWEDGYSCYWELEAVQEPLRKIYRAR